MQNGKVITIMKAEGMSLDDYDKVSEYAFGSARPALSEITPEFIVHSAGECGNKLRVVNVFESKEAFQQLLAETIKPAFEKAGITPSQAKVRELHNLYIGGEAGPGSTAVNMHVKGGTVDQYDAVMENLFDGGDVAGNAPQGLLVHASAPTDEGMWIFDIWQDSDSFQRFAERQLAAATKKVGMPDVAPKIYLLHNARVRASVREPALH